MRIVRIDDGAVVRLQVRGELDLATTDLVGEQVTRALAGDPVPDRLIVDLGGLTFCDSSGIDLLLAARAETDARGVEFRVARPRGIVRRSLMATGVLRALTHGTPLPAMSPTGLAAVFARPGGVEG
ncbi:STAS domain-containing protein [Actinoplanes sp. DH11]|uniref:STAS domain-containing protein n=1 Tax=Actinoplanes sp. DH11 TaxID=2857011 RepID=UPI001E4241CA|nr:STAS domain-containing protein [Actinoplanes sp. DH11]